MKYITSSICLILFSYVAGAQQIQQEQNYLRLLRDNFREQNAFEAVAFVEQRWRLAGNSGFNESIYYVENILQKAGFVKEVKGESDATLTYRIETRPMKRPTWEPVDAQLFIVGEDKPLLEFKTNRNMIAMYAASTPADGITAELVDIGKSSAKAYEGKDVKGKIVMADGSIGSVYGMAIKNGAIGALSYSLPAYTQPTKHVNSIQFSGIGYTDSLEQKWGILLSTVARERLRTALEKGPVQLHVNIKTKIYPSEELTIVANVRGTSQPDERFVFSAHVQEPGANDNASGVGTLAEMARVTAQLVKEGKLSPKRTITFLWGDEIVSTGRYIKDDSVRAKGIKWGLSLDMVGEDIKKTGGSFLIEKMPDPSAIWTRGNDKHTEWGGSALKESDMFPHYFNDLLLNRCLNEAKNTGWVVNTNPFEGGSDHTPFLRAHIPGLLMWHFTDVFYHTDGDRIDMVSAEEMKHVGISALVTALLLTNTNDKLITALIDDITGNALQRLQTEAVLSKKAVTDGSSTKEKEQHILEVWRDWYITAIGTTSDMSKAVPSVTVMKAVVRAQKKIREQTAKYIADL